MMKAAIAVLIMLMAASVLPAMASGDAAGKSIQGYENSRVSAAGADTKRIEDKMAEALNDLVSQKQAAIDKKKISGLIGTSPSRADNSSELPYTSLNSYRANTFATNSSAINLSATNSSTTNSSAMNSSSMNSSILNSQAPDLSAGDGGRPASDESDGRTSSGGTQVRDGSADPQGIESSSKTSFKGFYGITASQHEMGKNDINSRTFLSGTFSMDKSVKFQDRGI